MNSYTVGLRGTDRIKYNPTLLASLAYQPVFCGWLAGYLSTDLNSHDNGQVALCT